MGDMPPVWVSADALLVALALEVAVELADALVADALAVTDALEVAAELAVA
jgi:hypothetical protein